MTNRSPLQYADGGSVYGINAADFHAAVDPLLGDGRQWQSTEDGEQKLALQLGNGATWNVQGDDDIYGSGVYKYNPWSAEDQAKADEMAAIYQATGLAQYNPENIVAGGGSASDRANMMESWLGSGGAMGALKTAAMGQDTGEAGRIEAQPYTQEQWREAVAQDGAGQYNPDEAIYRVRGGMQGLVKGNNGNRILLDAGYQERDGQMTPIGTPSMGYQKTAGAENISGLSALLAAYTLGGSLAAQSAGGGAAAMAEAAEAANAANAAQGFGNLGVPVTQSVGQQALSAYQAAQPYMRAVNTLGSVASGNPMGAVLGYVPGVDLGLGQVGNQVANQAIRTGLSGGNPIVGAVSGAVGSMVPTELKQYLPMANALVSASNGKLTLQQALSLVKG